MPSDTSLTSSGGSVFSLRYWRAMPNERMPKIVLIAVVLCIFCSFFVSLAAISLKDLQGQNKLNEKRNNIVQVAKLQDKPGSLDEIFAKYIEYRLFDLENGTFSTSFDPKIFDALASRDDPDLSRRLTGAEDIAKIKVRENFAVVYLIKDDRGNYTDVIIPVRGYGLWSTLYGFMAVDVRDGNTINGLQFYDQGETPGLGAEVDNPRWRALWAGKKIYQGKETRIGVMKGNQSANPYGVDGLSGATLTSNGVSNLVKFWTGPLAFQKLLQNLPGNLSQS